MNENGVAAFITLRAETIQFSFGSLTDNASALTSRHGFHIPAQLIIRIHKVILPFHANMMNPTPFLPIIYICLLCVSHCTATAQSVMPLQRAHAHNDYLHERPLLDALDQGFSSVEADIYLVDGELLVAHYQWQLRPDRSLKTLYLDPLRKRVKSNGGRVFANGPEFTLLIDIKSDATSTFLALNKLLAEYPDVFSRIEDSKPIAGAVTAVISGNRDQKTILQSSPRYAGIDGRLTDLESGLPAHAMPLISDHWGRNFRWRGEGEIYRDDVEKLKKIVNQVHSSGRRIRFWAIPDQPQVWRAMNDAKVDLINTDKLVELSQFLRNTPTNQ
jgi:hypothetical protein